MDSRTTTPSHPLSNSASEVQPSKSILSEKDNPSDYKSSVTSTSGQLPSLSKNSVGPLPVPPYGKQDLETGNDGWSSFSRLASGLGLQFSSKASSSNESTGDSSANAQSGVLESITKGLVDSSMNAVKAMQVKARHIVSQNKRRYQEGGFDLDMTYITENIIAMGFPAGDMSSGFFGYVEGFYRNHMEEVIKFFETHHKEKYKVYNLCSERLYNASLFEGKVASFPFDDHNCPPIHLIKLFCQSAYLWLKEDIVNVVVIHCKAGKARTGLMICSLLLFLKFFTTAEECIDYYNQKRCVDGKGLILPSQIRYVKYFERILAHFNGEAPSGRRCMLRGFRLHKCPYWIRPSITIYNHSGVLFTTKKHPKTKDLMPEDFWIRAPRKGIVVFALPGEPGLTELVGDFKVHFHDRHGDFYCWLNTSMMDNRIILDASQLDGFDKRKLPSPGFEVEIVMIDYDGTVPAAKHNPESSAASKTTDDDTKAHGSDDQTKGLRSGTREDNVFSDSDGEEPSKTSSRKEKQMLKVIRNETEKMGIGGGGGQEERAVMKSEMKSDDTIANMGSTDIKAIAADASVFSFGDDEDEDYGSE
ncbi:unnamed protein product [Cuscuta campestris]|uniref:Phosphatidylinositol-3,4,5-trisphosphate 3-phosphatase n=1 Tax=Cuscuta campestris TaxID=132261 RepID=A0A484JZ39_9ASTE|nr:unnamed protein product [Cuscuta campestris]